MQQNNSLEWQNLCYSVPRKGRGLSSSFWKKPKEVVTILRNVSGSVHSGSLVAILGPSGSGKTTLLAAISQRLRGNVTGKIYLNGILADRWTLAHKTSYLPQYDISVQNLTSVEQLLFMCHFKMGKNISTVEKRQIVNALLTKMGLDERSTTIVAKLSSGERRRLGLAEELILNPLFIFCDEPTTGLDSFNALSVIKSLRSLSESKDEFISIGTKIRTFTEHKQLKTSPTMRNNFQKGVICSIHQPSSDIFELFTHIILLDNGRIIYQGSSNATSFFSQLGICYKQSCNPADLCIKLIMNEEMITKLRSLISNNQKSKPSQQNGNLYQAHSASSIIRSRSQKQISWISQVYYLLYRSTKNVRAAFYNDFWKTVFLLITAATIGVIYMDIKKDDQSSVQDIQGLMFMIGCEIIFTSSYAVIYEFPSTLPLIRRELGESIYTLSAYYTAQFLRRIPQATTQSFSFVIVVIAITNITNDYFVYLRMGLILTMTSMAAISYGLFLSSLFESSRIASEIAALFDLVFLLFGGYYLNLSSIPILKYFSLFFYCYEALSFDYWHGIQVLDCSTKAEFQCLQNGDEVLRNFSLRTIPQTELLDYVGLIMISLLMNSLALICVARYVRKVGYY
ncbi:protein brown isoform X1 [Hermetia illucens]|uniref:protein brown isoform X1 n=1 Tax=Hermetia illucens TaxID=343691 RepID=UPI0018CBF3C4|nr:protein brown isoform X1 [Hermetia illucens]